MSEKSALILGGYGNSGKLIASFLLERSDIHLVLAGRDKQKAERLSSEFNRTFNTDRVKGIALDASDLGELQAALQGVSILIVASSTAQFVELTAKACIAAGVDYFDIQYSAKKVRLLQGLSAEIKNSGLCFVTDGGFHPGLPAALIRYGASKFDQIFKANVASVIKEDWSKIQVSDATIKEMAQEFGDFSMAFFHNKAWKKARMDIVMDTINMDFGPPFGKQLAMPMFLEEIRHLPAIFPSLTDCGFFVGGFNFITDNFLMPVMLFMVKISPQKGLQPAGDLLLWGLKKFSHPPYGTRLKLEAEGLKNNVLKHLEILLSHDDGYVFTAIPASAAVIQLLDGTIRKPGLFTQGELVDPERFIQDMQAMGISIQIIEF